MGSFSNLPVQAGQNTIVLKTTVAPQLPPISIPAPKPAPSCITVPQNVKSNPSGISFVEREIEISMNSTNDKITITEPKTVLENIDITKIDNSSMISIQALKEVSDTNITPENKAIIESIVYNQHGPVKFFTPLANAENKILSICLIKSPNDVNKAVEWADKLIKDTSIEMQGNGQTSIRSDLINKTVDFIVAFMKSESVLDSNTERRFNNIWKEISGKSAGRPAEQLVTDKLQRAIDILSIGENLDIDEKEAIPYILKFK